MYAGRRSCAHRGTLIFTSGLRLASPLRPREVTAVHHAHMNVSGAGRWAHRTRVDRRHLRERLVGGGGESRRFAGHACARRQVRTCVLRRQAEAEAGGGVVLYETNAARAARAHTDRAALTSLTGSGVVMRRPGVLCTRRRTSVTKNPSTILSEREQGVHCDARAVDPVYPASIREVCTVGSRYRPSNSFPERTVNEAGSARRVAKERWGVHSGGINSGSHCPGLLLLCGPPTSPT
ncbi:hypothetical protein B0H11DRAFT_2095102 [Mycena galericulata]|nr:hypothetical protein B0H11DRAFT_2095102 [Mycena galericulata]